VEDCEELHVQICVKERIELVQLRHDIRQDCVRCGNVCCCHGVCSRLFVQSGMGEGDVLGRSLTLMFVISSITNNEQMYPKNLMPIG
jgi:hypothetical protein